MTKNSFVADVTFKRFIIFAFRNYFTLCKIVLYIWRKIFFFLPPQSYEKSDSKLSKYEPECMCKWGWCFEQTILNNLGGIEKK